MWQQQPKKLCIRFHCLLNLCLKKQWNSLNFVFPRVHSVFQCVLQMWVGFFFTTSEMDSNIFRCKMQFAWNFFVFLTQNINANLLYIEAVKRNTLILAIDMPKCDTQLHFKQMVWWVVVVVSHSLVDVCQQFKAGCWFFCFEAQRLCGIDGNGIGWLKKCAFDS